MLKENKKLETGTLENIEFSELKKLFKKQKKLGVVNFREYYRQQIFDMLEKYDTFDKKEFGEINKNINSPLKKEYIKQIKKHREDFSYSLIDNFIKITNGDIETFKKEILEKCFFTDEYIKIKNLDFIMKLYNDIETSDEFLNIKREISWVAKGKEKNFQNVMRFWNPKKDNLHYFMELLNKILTPGTFVNHVEIDKIIIDGDEIILEKILKVYNIETFDNILNLFKDEKIYSITLKGKRRNFNNLWKLYNIQTSDDFEKSLTQLSEYILEINEEILEIIIGLCKTPDDFEKIAKTENILDILKKINNDKLKEILEIHNIKTAEDFLNFIKNENKKDILILKGIDEKILELIMDLFNFQYPNDLNKIDEVVISSLNSANNIKNVQKIINLFNNLEDFNIMFKAMNLCFILEKADEESLDIIIGLCNKPSDFIYICKYEKLPYILFEQIKHNLKIIINGFNIKTIYEFKNIFNIKNIDKILSYASDYSTNFNIIVESFDTLNDFIDYFNYKNKEIVDIISSKEKSKEVKKSYKEGIIIYRQNKEVEYIHSYTENEENFQTIVGLCKTPDDYKIIGKNQTIKKVLSYINNMTNNLLKEILEIYDIKTAKDFIELITDESISIIFYEEGIELIKKSFNIQAKDDLKKIHTVSIKRLLFCNDYEKLERIFKNFKTLEQLISFCEDEDFGQILEQINPFWTKLLVWLYERKDLKSKNFLENFFVKLLMKPLKLLK